MSCWGCGGRGTCFLCGNHAAARLKIKGTWKDELTGHTDDQLVNRIEAIRAQNNTHWMDIVRLSLELAPERTKELLRKIEACDGEVRRLTQELAK